LNDLLIIGFRTFFLYFFILFVLRVMGKREVGELGILDVVVFIIMAEVASMAIEDTKSKLFHTVFPILLLLLIQLITSYISLKSKKFRDLVDGEPSVIIRNGKILEDEMRRQRYNLAFLEPSGNLSVFTKDDTQPVLALISDGVIQNRHIEIVGITEQQLINELTKLGINDTKHIFYCSYERGRFEYQLKEEFQ
jgi:uncharacterized membrane protein YcaP (DUF421 family)